MIQKRIRALALVLAVACALALPLPRASAQTRGRKTFAAVTVTTSATLVLAAATSAARSVVIVNNGSVTVYLGKANTVTTSNGIPLAAGQSLSDRDSLDAWYGITGSGSADVRVLETK